MHLELKSYIPLFKAMFKFSHCNPDFWCSMSLDGFCSSIDWVVCGVEVDWVVCHLSVKYRKPYVLAHFLILSLSFFILGGGGVIDLHYEAIWHILMLTFKV